MRERAMSAITYIYLWKKYRPVILSMMVAAEKDPQKYQFAAHEFRDINPKKPNLSFDLHVHDSRSINDIKTSQVAQDLLYVLQSSPKASELSESDIYEFELDKEFFLHVRKLSVPEQESEES